MSKTTRPTANATSLPITVVVLLAALAVPRVVLHDLGVITSGPVNTILVFVPPIIWIAVVLARRVTAVFTTLLTIGLVYGVFLALGHQLFWNVAFGPEAPALGGNLDGVLPPGAEALVLRAFSVVGSVVTGLLVGAISGVLGWAVSSARRRTGPA